MVFITERSLVFAPEKIRRSLSEVLKMKEERVDMVIDN